MNTEVWTTICSTITLALFFHVRSLKWEHRMTRVETKLGIGVKEEE